MRPSDDVAAAGRRGAGRNENRARNRDCFALQSNGAVKEPECVAITRAPAFEWPHPNDASRLARDLARLDVVKRFGRLSAKTEKHGQRPRRCIPRQTSHREHSFFLLVNESLLPQT